MFDTLGDGLTPRFVFRTPVFLDELDHGSGQLSHDRLTAHIQQAVDAFHGADEVNVIRDANIEFLHPVTSAGELRVDVWLDAIDETTCTYGFLCSSTDGTVAHARGERTISKLDPLRRRPSTWSDAFLASRSAIVKAMHNCA